MSADEKIVSMEDHKKVSLLRFLMGKMRTNDNTLLSRATFGGTQTFEGNRDLYTALGYPSDGKITFTDYLLKFKRQDIASKIVEKPVEGAWRQMPIVRATDDDNSTFKDAFNEVEKELGLFDTLIRADIIAGIGEYGIVLLGYNDAAEDLKDELTSAKALLYAQPYLQDNASIKSLNEDKNSPRYGLPEMYGVQTSKSTTGTKETVENLVHHSRILHIADNLLESNIYGLPRLEKVYNRLLNMELIVGGSAEMFWQGAFPGLAFKADEDYDITQVSDALTEEIQKYVHNLERYMKLQGVDVQNLAPAVADPSNHVDVQLKMISIATGIPKRILEGSERGELASSQDSDAWDAYCDRRRRMFVEPRIVRPVVNSLIESGVLTAPQGGYTIEWPDLYSPSDKDRADVAKVRSETIKNYASVPDAQILIPPRSFFEVIMEMEEEKVDEILAEMETAIKEMQDREAEEEARIIEEEQNRIKKEEGEEL